MSADEWHGRLVGLGRAPFCPADKGGRICFFALEAEIDQLVYALYALTPEEIAVVEGEND